LGHVALVGHIKYAYKVLMGRLQGKRPHGRPRRRWEDNVNMDLNVWTGFSHLRIGTSSGRL